MRAICDMDNIQIEITDACVRSCSNCTRFCGHRKPFFIDFEYFKQCVDSVIDYPKIVGFMGGEPLLHPRFEQMCEYALDKIGRDRLGLWTGLPDGKEHLAETICKTFKHIFVNDHSRDDVLHAPILVGVEDIYPDRGQMFYVIDHCWLQNLWSASINPNGAFFCEIAASMSLLYGDSPHHAWPVDKQWWYRTPKDFKVQIEQYCPRCGVCVPLARRCSNDGVDDISQRNLDTLKGRSIKLADGKYVLSDLKLVTEPGEMAAYKDTYWRNQVSARYGIFQSINEKGYWEPYLIDTKPCQSKTLLDEYREIYRRVE